MTKTKTAAILGGYDAKSCPVKASNNHHPAWREVQQDPIPAGDAARMAAGISFEAGVGQAWQQAMAGCGFVAVPDADRSAQGKSLREAATADAMASQTTQVVWNARLVPQPHANRGGEPDALVRHAAGWLAVDVKDHKVLEGTGKSRAWQASDLSTPFLHAARETLLGPGNLKKSDALQLAHYYRMLQDIGADAGPTGGIIGREGTIVWFPLDEPLWRHPQLGKVSALQWYDHEFARRVDIVLAAQDGISLVGPELKEECRSCVWRTACKDEMVEADHITLLPGMTPARAETHYALGTTKRAQLARLSWPTARLVDAGANPAAIAALARSQQPSTPVEQFAGGAEAMALKAAGMTRAEQVRVHAPTSRYAGSGVWNLARSIDQARVAKAGKVYRARGVDAVSITRCRVEQDIDIEDEGGYVYLIGTRTLRRRVSRGTSQQVVSYEGFVNWGRDEDGEAQVFAQWWEHVQSTMSQARGRGLAYCAYHYTQHEPAAFRALAARHAGKSGVPSLADLDTWLTSGSLVDLYPILSGQLIWPTESASLKDLAKWVRFSWRDAEPGGSNSLAWFAQAVDGPDEQDARERILAYNEDDCAAQAAIRDWLTRLGESRAPGAKLPSVADLDRRFRRGGP